MTLDIDLKIWFKVTAHLFPQTIYNKVWKGLWIKKMSSAQGIIKGFWCNLELSDLKNNCSSSSSLHILYLISFSRWSMKQENTIHRKKILHIDQLWPYNLFNQESSRSLHSLYANALCGQRMSQIELRGEKICFGQDISVGQTTNRLITTGLPQNGDLRKAQRIRSFQSFTCFPNVINDYV